VYWWYRSDSHCFTALTNHLIWQRKTRIHPQTLKYFPCLQNLRFTYWIYVIKSYYYLKFYYDVMIYQSRNLSKLHNWRIFLFITYGLPFWIEDLIFCSFSWLNTFSFTQFLQKFGFLPYSTLLSVVNSIPHLSGISYKELLEKHNSSNISVL
jgi:hypothetical protein